MTAHIKTDSVEGKGAGLNIGLYDSSDQLISNKDMGGFYSLDWVRGSKDWKIYSISIVCPLTTRKISIGMILYGKGKAWFSNCTVSSVSIANRKPSRLARQYIQAACDTIKMHSLLRDSIHIDELKAMAMKIAGPAKKYSDCYLAINYLLEALRPYGDHHSFFMTAKEVTNWKNEGSQVSKVQYPSSDTVDSCAYIVVPAFHGGNNHQILAYADSLQAAIQKLSQQGIKGWIIDLRQNTGGNMAPMIAGLGPLFSSEKLGSLVDVNGKPSSWYYRKGKYYWDNDTGFIVSKPVFLSSRLPIAVLTSHQTGSSGEAVVVSFLGNEETRSFGQPTWGLTTGNGSFDLPDGSQIFLASTIMADRKDRQYSESIIPDVVIETKEAENRDEVLRTAINWIKQQYPN
ncbi:MAG: S41 family peptidase [Flavisolibacter sp.]